MKIPSNKVLLSLSMAGVITMLQSLYWIGRRDELDQIIDLGRNAKGTKALDMFDRNNIPVELYIKTIER